MYKFDTHVHTAEVSPCATPGAAGVVKLYHKAEYSGICITDHYNGYVFDYWGCNTWEKRLDKFLEGYRKAKDAGEKYDLDVLLGVELSLSCSVYWIDYLLFGVTEQFLRDYPDLHKYEPKALRELADENSILIFQAHPFRSGNACENPLFLDGVEAMNGSQSNEVNDLAAKFAKENNLLISAGSDCHSREGVGRSGISTTKRIINVEELKQNLTESTKIIRTNY